MTRRGMERYTQMRREIHEAYNRELWDEKAGLYQDGRPFVTSTPPGPWLPADKDIETHSSQNNALAVLYDLAPTERQAPIMRRLIKAGLNCQPYFMFFIFERPEPRRIDGRVCRPTNAPLANPARYAVVPRDVEQRRLQPRMAMRPAL